MSLPPLCPVRLLAPTVLAVVSLCGGAAQAHHDGPVLPLSLNAPGAVGSLANPAGQTETKFGLSSRAFRVSDHALYGPTVGGGDATVLFNGVYGAWAVSPHLSLETLLPLVTDVPSGEAEGSTGIGDVRFGARWFTPWQRLEALWALGAEVSLPTGNAELGFGADAFVTRASARLARDFAAARLRMFVEAGVAAAWSEQRGSLADVAVAGMWQAMSQVGLFCELRALTALESGRRNALEFVGRTRAPGDTSVVITPAVIVNATSRLALALGPQIPFGFRDFDFGFALSATYRLQP